MARYRWGNWFKDVLAMKLRLLILLFMLPSALFAQRAMRNSIDYLLKDKLLDVVDASVMVYDLDDDTLLYAHR